MSMPNGESKRTSFEQILALGTDLKSLDSHQINPTTRHFPPPLRTPGIVTPDLWHQMATSLSQASHSHEQIAPVQEREALSVLDLRRPFDDSTACDNHEGSHYRDDTLVSWDNTEDQPPRCLLEPVQRHTAWSQPDNPRRTQNVEKHKPRRVRRWSMWAQPADATVGQKRSWVKPALVSTTACILILGALAVHSARLDAGKHAAVPQLECSDARGRLTHCLRLNMGGAPGFKASLSILSAVPDDKLENFATPAGSVAVPREDAAVAITLDRSTLSQPMVRATAQVGLDLVFDPADRKSILLPLAVHSDDEPHPLDLVLIKGLPAGSTLSSGTQLSPHQWAIQTVTLAGLRLSLPDDTPTRFVMSVEVMRHSGDIQARSMIAVRAADRKPEHRRLSQASGQHWLIDERALVASTNSTGRPPARLASIDPRAGLEEAAAAYSHKLIEPVREVARFPSPPPPTLQAQPAPASRSAAIDPAPSNGGQLQSDALPAARPSPRLPIAKPAHNGSKSAKLVTNDAHSPSAPAAMVQPPTLPPAAVASPAMPDWALVAFGWK